MTDAWEDAVAAFWDGADRADSAGTLAAMRALVSLRPEGDAAALFELASAHDFVSHEEAAVPLYEEALASGLDPRRQDEAIIQLASSLRNVGRQADAVALLDRSQVSPALAPAASAFRVLALYDLGEASAAQVTAASAAAAPTQYGRAVSRYAAQALQVAG